MITKEENKDLEAKLHKVSHEKSDKATSVYEEVRQLRKEVVRIKQAKDNGQVFSTIEQNISSYYQAMGFDVDPDVQRKLDDANDYARNPDSQKYLESFQFRKFKNIFLLTLLASEYLDFENVVKKYETENEWPKKIFQYLIKDKKFSRYITEEELIGGLQDYHRSGLKLKDFVKYFEIKEYSNTLPDKKDLDLFSKIAMKNPKRLSLEGFFILRPEEGGLGVMSDDEEVDLAEVIYYGLFAGSRFEKAGGLYLVFSALSQIMRIKSNRCVQVDQLLEVLKNRSDGEHQESKHFISTGLDNKMNGNRGIKSGNVFDKSSEIKMKEEEIPFTDGVDHRRSESTIGYVKVIESKLRLLAGRRLLMVLASSKVRTPERLLNLSLSLDERVKNFVDEVEANAGSEAQKSEDFKQTLDKNAIKSMFETILATPELKMARSSQQNELLIKELKLGSLAVLPSYQQPLNKLRQVAKSLNLAAQRPKLTPQSSAKIIEW